MSSLPKPDNLAMDFPIISCDVVPEVKSVVVSIETADRLLVPRTRIERKSQEKFRVNILTDLTWKEDAAYTAGELLKFRVWPQNGVPTESDEHAELDYTPLPDEASLLIARLEKPQTKPVEKEPSSMAQNETKPSAAPTSPGEVPKPEGTAVQSSTGKQEKPPAEISVPRPPPAKPEAAKPETAKQHPAATPASQDRTPETPARDLGKEFDALRKETDGLSKKVVDVSEKLTGVSSEVDQLKSSVSKTSKNTDEILALLKPKTAPASSEQATKREIIVRKIREVAMAPLHGITAFFGIVLGLFLTLVAIVAMWVVISWMMQHLPFTTQNSHEGSATASTGEPAGVNVNTTIVMPPPPHTWTEPVEKVEKKPEPTPAPAPPSPPVEKQKTLSECKCEQRHSQAAAAPAPQPIVVYTQAQPLVVERVVEAAPQVVYVSEPTRVPDPYYYGRYYAPAIHASVAWGWSSSRYAAYGHSRFWYPDRHPGMRRR